MPASPSLSSEECTLKIVSHLGGWAVKTKKKKYEDEAKKADADAEADAGVDEAEADLNSSGDRSIM